MKPVKSLCVVKPFVKWAGGKGQLLTDIRNKYPVELQTGLNRYCEPFVGGGAVLLDVLSRYEMKEVLINDINAELMNAYQQIQNHVFDLLKQLQEMQDFFWQSTEERRKTYYYESRKLFNDMQINGCEQINLKKAALLIFLNKTCFNGLYRVNKRGSFNVPMGAYKNPNICDCENLLEISKLLQNVNLQCGDYKNCLSFIDSSTFVYIDPPYRPLTKTANFTAYTDTLFDDDEQIALGRFVDAIHSVGAKVIVSNSDPKNADGSDDFFDNLYGRYNIRQVSARRMINCNANSRGIINELLITNF